MKICGKHFIAVALISSLIVLGSVSCKTDDPVEEPAPEITETKYYEDVKMTSYNFEYSSKDPYGKSVRLSGAITIGDEVTKDAPATGLFLYNHFTVYQKDECPSHGDLMVQKMLVGSGFITISADYYGFGSTEDKNQAYCIANTNAQASVDALLAAKKLLTSMGYTWNDVLFNAGYSQGGQTTVAVVKYVTENYPDIHFDWSFAGGGPYSIPLTYDTFISKPETEMPSTVISVLLSYNEFYNLGFEFSQLFKEPLLSNIDEWFYSKKYTNGELDQFLTTKLLTDYINEEALNKESDIYKKFSAAMEKENLCSGWEPSKEENIVIEHNESDNVVTVENARALLKFFEDKGLSVSQHDENKDSGVIDYIDDFGDMTAFMNIGPHPWGALPFLVEIISHIQDLPGLKEFSPSEAAMMALIQ